MVILILLLIVVLLLTALYLSLEPSFDYIQSGNRERQVVLWYNGTKGRHYILLWKYHKINKRK